MNLADAINSVCAFLTRVNVTFTLFRAWQPAEAVFRVVVHQVRPDDRLRAFELNQADVADCWNMTELNIEEVKAA